MANLTQERLKEVLHYDPATGGWTWLVTLGKAGFGEVGSKAGYNREDGRRCIGIDGKLYLGSRLAYLYMVGAWPPEMVDHKDGDRSNDCWNNLRPATKAQNQNNARVRWDCQSGLKGAFLDKKHGVYYSRIYIHGKSTFLGTFLTAAAANDAYNKAAREYHGTFAECSR